MLVGGEQRQEQRISIPVILVFALDIWQEKNGKFVILWIDYFHFLNNNAQEKFLPLNQFRELQIYRFFPARYPKQRQE